MKSMLRLGAFGLLAVLVLAGFSAGAGAAESKVAAIPTYANEADAGRACPKDVVVWANKDSKVLHLKGARWYGKTKDGAYVCKDEALRAGYKLAKQD